MTRISIYIPIIIIIHIILGQVIFLFSIKRHSKNYHINKIYRNSPLAGHYVIISSVITVFKLQSLNKSYMYRLTKSYIKVYFILASYILQWFVIYFVLFTKWKVIQFY